MNQKLLQHILAVWLAMNLIASCAPAPAALDGQVLPLHPGAVQVGIRLVQSGASGTAIFAKDALRLVAWRVADGWGFLCFNCANAEPIADALRAAGGKGNWVTPATFSDLANHLKTSGWAQISGGVTAAKPLIDALLAAGAPMIGIGIFPADAIPDEAWIIQQ